jgi:hypothetical protein
MQRVASSTVDILMKPNPLERSDLGNNKKGSSGTEKGRADSLVVNNGHFFDSSEPAEFFIQVVFLSANTKTKHPKYIGRVGRLSEHVNKAYVARSETQLTMGACGGRLGGRGDRRR